MLTIDIVINETAKHYGFHPARIKGKERYQNIAHARHVAMYLARKLVPMTSYPVIGRAFEGRDHTTAMAAVAKVERLLVTSDLVRGQVAALNEKLKPYIDGRLPREAAPLAASYAEQLAEVGT